MTTTEELYHIYNSCSKVNTDSRNVQAGELFFALKGANFDGNKFAADALKKGASYAVIDNAEFKISDQYLLVHDTLQALQQLALYHRNNLNIPFIAIAGSNGKTTTKELIREVLKTSFETFATPGNYNNEIGVPLTLLQIGSNVEMAVIELGARHMGDIAELCRLCNPTHGLVTNNGKDHLETFKTLENTLKTNAELYDHLAETQGMVFLNVKHHDLIHAAHHVQDTITYGNDAQANYFGMVEQLFPYLTISYQSEGEKVQLESKLIGQYNFENIMAAVAIGKHFEVNDRLIKKAIEAYAPTNNRSQLLERDSNTYILDAYNANPSSMTEALNKIAILGDMLELGDASYEEHLLIALKLKNIKLENIILLGNEFGKVKDKLNCQHFNTTEEAKGWFAAQNYQGHLFLLKGSRGIAVEKILG